MSGGYVYVVEFDSGMIKVGHSQAIAQRLQTHKQIARSFGLTVSRCWESPCHDGWLENERALKRIASELGGTPTTPEYFNDVSYDALVEKANELPFPAPAQVPAPAQAVAETEVGQVGPAATTGFRGRTVREAAIEAWAAKAPDRARAVLHLWDMGFSPEFSRDQMDAPRTAAEMQELLDEEAAIRGRLNQAAPGERPTAA